VTKEKAKEKLIEIYEMDKIQLNEFSQKLFLSKADIKPKVFKVLEKAVMNQAAYLNDKISTNAFVEFSELREGEL